MVCAGLPPTAPVRPATGAGPSSGLSGSARVLTPTLSSGAFSSTTALSSARCSWPIPWRARSLSRGRRVWPPASTRRRASCRSAPRPVSRIAWGHKAASQPFEAHDVQGSPAGAQPLVRVPIVRGQRVCHGADILTQKTEPVQFRTDKWRRPRCIGSRGHCCSNSRFQLSSKRRPVSGGLSTWPAASRLHL
jgi:hypothetical protein